MRATFDNLRLIISTIAGGLFAQRYLAEAVLACLFFIQALRFLIGELYARVSSAVVATSIDPALIDASTPPGLVQPEVVTGEIALLGYMLLLPLLALPLGRVRASHWLALVVVVAGRTLMTLPNAPLTPAAGAAIAVGGGLWYIAMLVRQRAPLLPAMFVLAFAIDQLYRAYGDTLDPSWSAGYAVIQVGLAVFTALLGLLNVARVPKDDPRLTPGLMPFFAGPALGALLFLQIALLAMPNVVAARAGTDYTLFVPLLVVATLLPLIPLVRGWARAFIALFDASVRGWSWLLLAVLLIVFGLRFQGIVAGVALMLAQLVISLLWWWLVRPQAERERNLSALWIIFGVLTFAVLFVFDLFTFEYAYVRDLAPPLAFLNPIVPPFQRGFRGLGLAVILLAVFVAALPMVQARRRIPWQGGTLASSLLMILLTAGLAGYAAWVSRPPQVGALRNAETIRVATYNIHAGFNEFFLYDLEAIASTIQRSGADVVLLQEVEAGRMTSYGVDQALWLARRLTRLLAAQGQGMDVRYYPTNEGLHGLAVLSKIEIVLHEGQPLTSIGQQTGLQRVVVQPDEGVVTFYNTWLGILVAGPDVETQELDQQRQLSEIFTLIAAAYPNRNFGRMVVGGTFNNVPDSPLMRRMATETPFIDPFADAVPALSDTLVRTGVRARLDYLWTNLGVLQRGTIDSSASDHRPAVIEVRIGR